MNLKTNSETVFPQKVNYGLDAPIFQRSALFGGLAAAVLGTLVARWAQQHDSQIVFNCAPPIAWTGLWFFLTGCVMFWGSKVGKLRLRDKIIASIPWRGDERVLDVGCGHGLMLLAAAKQLKSGRAIGVDIWSQADHVATCFVAMRLVMPILVFDALIGFLGFGLYLMYRERRDRRLRVQHA